MVNYAGIQNKIDRGRGKAASKLGQPYNVFRNLTTGGATNFLDTSNKVASNYLCFRKGIGGGAVESVETETKQGTFWYQMVSNLIGFKTGDVFIQNDPLYGAGFTSVTFATVEFNGLCLASHAPVKKTIAARVDRLASIYRPASTGPDTNNYFSNQLSQMLPLQLTAGIYALAGSPTATPTLIPVGMMPHARPYGGNIFDEVPGMPKKTLWFVYVPPLNGFFIHEQDKIQLQDGSIYTVLHPYEQYAGCVGFQLVCERETL